MVSDIPPPPPPSLMSTLLSFTLRQHMFLYAQNAGKLYQAPHIELYSSMHCVSIVGRRYIPNLGKEKKGCKICVFHLYSCLFVLFVGKLPVHVQTNM